jgi:hypothetical protein
MCSEFDYVATVAGGSRSNGCADSFGYGSYVRSNVSQEKNADLA